MSVRTHEQTERLWALYAMSATPRESVEEGRAWLLDCCDSFGDKDEMWEEISLLNHVGVVKAVDSHYEGGYRQFLLDGCAL